MPSYEHTQIIKTIGKVDQLPSSQEDFESWILAGSHIGFLRNNAASSEILMYWSGEYSFIYAAVIPNRILKKLTQDKLLDWYGTPFETCASYVYGGGRSAVWVERASNPKTQDKLDRSIQLVYSRSFEGWAGVDRDYFEINQEYAHVAGIHWRPEHKAYCRYDEKGDLCKVISISKPTKEGENVTCVSFAWEPLEEYLAATDSTLIRRFDFTLLRKTGFTMWPEGPEAIVAMDKQLFYRQKVNKGIAAYTTGIQLIPCRRSKAHIFVGLRGDAKKTRYAEYVSFDFRNNRIVKISTNPVATTNYFEAKYNSLPFDLSPAFFRPEVLSKYKTDKDKYTIGDRHVSCRSAWHLRSYDVNEAGQIFAYICDLRMLPYEEQLHWFSFNEEPKTGISERAFTNDFKGEFTSFQNPLQAVFSILKSWNEKNEKWWTLKNANLFRDISKPLTASRDEWAEAFLGLSKLVVEGFNAEAIRTRLAESCIDYTDKDRTINLLKKLVSGKDRGWAEGTLGGLSTVQSIRNKVKSHVPGGDADAIYTDALQKHGNLANHFMEICKLLVVELNEIANRFNSRDL